VFDGKVAGKKASAFLWYKGRKPIDMREAPYSYEKFEAEIL